MSNQQPQPPHQSWMTAWCTTKGCNEDGGIGAQTEKTTRRYCEGEAGLIFSKQDASGWASSQTRHEQSERGDASCGGGGDDGVE